MNKAEIKKPLDYEIWHTEEDKDVLLVSPDETFFSNKKRILQHYLKRANDNVVSFELEEEEKNKLIEHLKLYPGTDYKQAMIDFEKLAKN